MATYRIQSPDGQSFDVTAPDDASQDQVLEYAKSNWSKGQAKAAPQPKAPAEDPGIARTLLIGAGKTTNSILDGLTQMYLGARGENSALGGLKQNVEDNADPYKRLQELRPFATGVGEAIPSMAIPMGGSATLLGTAGKMALAGGVPQALEYGTPQERLKRGALGAAAGAAVPLGVAVAKTGWSLAEPLYDGGRQAIAARTMNRVAGSEAPAVASRLKAAQPLVPNSMPTAAQVAENGGIAALERSAAQANPTPFTTRGMEQSSARLGALRGIAQDEAALRAAETARDAAAGPLYNQAKQAVVAVDDDLRGILGRLPDGVLSRAKNLARMNGEAINLGDDATELGGGALHYIKLALDDAIGKTGESGMGAAEKRAAMGVKEALLTKLDDAIPAYGQARSQFAQLSKPVNQMEIGQELLTKVQPALADFGALGSETGATFGKALRDADLTAARATGFKGARMADVLTPDQMKTLESVAMDLARKSTAQNLGRGVGSDTFQKLAMQNIAEQSGMPRLTGGLLSLPGVSRATNWIYRDTDKQIQALLADALLNPAIAGDMMGKANTSLLQSSPKARKLLGEAAVRSGGLLGLSAVD